MKLRFKYCLIGALILCSVFLFGCEKFLDKKPRTNIAQPSTLSDFQNLLDNANVMNVTANLPQISSDEYYIPDYASYQALGSLTLKNGYVWAKDIYGGTVRIPDWNQLYSTIFYANNILEGLPDITVTSFNEQTWNTIKGSALFHRAYAMYDLVRNYSEVYDSSSSDLDLGIPLKLSAGIDVNVPRSSVEATYNQILSDLKDAKDLLSNTVNANNNNRPSKPAVFALLSRVYLSMRAYTKAEEAADSCLSLYNQLIDYNTLSTTSSSPFPLSSKETIFFSSQAAVSDYSPITYNTNITAIYSVDSNLIKLYDLNDLRASIFFLKVNTNYRVKRLYTIAIIPFTGLATDEIYLIKAECAARRNDVSMSMGYLNTLLINRYKTGKFTPLSSATVADALDKILTERRKELVWRSLRWSDLKRLNKEGRNITLNRVVNGEVYSLPPNDARYVFPIPDDEIALSGIIQNNR